MNNQYNPITRFSPIVEQQIEQQIQSVTVDQIKKIFQSKQKLYGGIPKSITKKSKMNDYLNALDNVINSIHVLDPLDLEWMALDYE